MLQLFEVVQTEPVAFPPGIPASLELKELLLGMLEKVGIPLLPGNDSLPCSIAGAESCCWGCWRRWGWKLVGS